MKLLTKFVFLCVVYSLTNKVTHQFPSESQSTLLNETRQLNNSNGNSTHRTGTKITLTKSPTTKTPILNYWTSRHHRSPTPSTSYIWWWYRSTKYFQTFTPTPSTTLSEPELISKIKLFFSVEVEDEYMDFFKWYYKINTEPIDKIEARIAFGKNFTTPDYFKQFHKTPFKIPVDYFKYYVYANAIDEAMKNAPSTTTTDNPEYHDVPPYFQHNETNNVPLYPLFP